MTTVKYPSKGWSAEIGGRVVNLIPCHDADHAAEVLDDRLNNSRDPVYREIINLGPNPDLGIYADADGGLHFRAVIQGPQGATATRYIRVIDWRVTDGIYHDLPALDLGRPLEPTPEAEARAIAAEIEAIERDKQALILRCTLLQQRLAAISDHPVDQPFPLNIETDATP